MTSHPETSTSSRSDHSIKGTPSNPRKAKETGYVDETVSSSKIKATAHDLERCDDKNKCSRSISELPIIDNGSSSTG